jgi:hypothetical protein
MTVSDLCGVVLVQPASGHADPASTLPRSDGAGNAKEETSLSDIAELLSPEQIAWLESFTGVTLQPTAQSITAKAPDTSSAKPKATSGAASPSPHPQAAVAAKSSAPAAHHPKPTDAGKITYDSFNFLVAQLQYLADPQFHTKRAPALILQ